MNTPSVSLVYDRRKDGKGKLELSIYFPVDKKTMYISTGFNIPPEHFDRELSLISTEATNYVNMTNGIKLQEHGIKDLLRRLEDKLGRDVSKDDFTTAYKEKKMEESGKAKKKYSDFISLCETEVTEDNNISESTRTNYLQTVKLLKEFKKKIPFSDVSFNLAFEFNKFLRKRFSNSNTILKHFVTLKRYVRLANQLGYISNENATNILLFKIQGQDSHKEVLLPEEINKIMELEYEKDSKEYMVKGMFLFSYFTGLRVSDVKKLSIQHFSVNEDGLHLNIPIKKLKRYNRTIRENLSKAFSGEPERVIRPFLDEAVDLLFPPILEKEILEVLEKIIKDAGIKKHITFHCARHSGITLVAHLTGDPYSVMEFGAITSLQTAQRYTHLAEEMFKNKIEKLEWNYKL